MINQQMGQNNFYFIKFLIFDMATKTIRRFKFNDLRLAKKVRGNMLDALIAFDANQNLLFDAEQIRQALITILGEDQLQVQYVVKNVFRYDRDGDGAITYAQLTNFCVQQHFGQMAIQRLHKKGYYVNGSKRVMSLEEFQATLNYCLNFINSKGTHQDYQRLFNEVDLDKDGLITYQEYFIFLRQYFGSQSQAFQEEQKKNKQPEPKPPKPSIDFVDGNGETPQQRFAKLIYSQFKITVMERDRNKNLLLQRQQVQDILSNILKLNYNQSTQLQDKFMGGSNTVKYDDFLRVVVTNYLSTIGPQRISPANMNENQFIQLINKLCHFVAIKPADHVLLSCFKTVSRGSKTISQSDYTYMIKNIFENFKFDSRGLPSTRSKTQKIQSISPRSYY